jgi:hypothetical protein
MYIKLIAAMIAAVTVAACQTGAQKKQQQMVDNVAAARAAYEPCLAEVDGRPEFQGIRAKMPGRGTGQETSLQILANKDVPTESEVAAIYAYHQALQPCRKIALEGMRRVHPALVTLFAEAYADQDQLYVGLVRRQSTWSDFAQASEARKAKLGRDLQAVGQEIDQQLANEQAYELEQRQRAAQALSELSARQQLLYQQQQYLNRPKLTDCTYQGHFLSCTTF